ncbi:pentapeptide repeat-containing protein [Paludisphaera soli]|uniref:pentapeptide repeat-containing protein n=1 Tax=Paludisphaera soli TaxID=2712865 RepID=UPI0013EA783D|nr:pentapeptide repeat-containing protein [Paludisphaera soli]
MAVHTLLRRWCTGPLALVEAESQGRAVELAARAGVPLAYADLKGIEAPRCFLPDADLRGADLDAAILPGAYLRRADLRTATLVDADLAGAVLRQADLRDARLRDADLRRADLRDARLAGADLRGVRLTGARLEGAAIDWRWAAVAVELLRRDPGCRGDSLRLVVELALERDERPYAWLRPIFRGGPGIVDWACSVLGRAILPGDDAPEILRRLAADADVEPSARTAADRPGRLYWTRAVGPRGRRSESRSD